MHAWGGREVLQVWERIAGRPTHEQALGLLAASFPDSDPRTLAELPLGLGAFWLLEQQRRTFGPEVELFAACPACGAELEARLRIEDLLTSTVTPAADARVEVAIGSEALGFRLPGLGDLLALAAGPEPVTGTALLARCFAGGALPALDDEAIEIVASRLAAADPLAEILLDLRCPGCDHAWQALVEPALCLGREVEAAARRLLAEIHALARSYGWREQEVLDLSPRRRRAYLEMLAG